MKDSCIVVQDDEIVYGDTKEKCLEFAKALWIPNKKNPRPSKRVYVYKQIKEYRMKEG